MTVHVSTTNAPETLYMYTICSRGICLIKLTHWTFNLILIHEVERSSPIGDQLTMTPFRPVCYCRCILLEWNYVLDAKQGAFLIHDVIRHKDIMLHIKIRRSVVHLIFMMGISFPGSMIFIYRLRPEADFFCLFRWGLREGCKQTRQQTMN